MQQAPVLSCMKQQRAIFAEFEVFDLSNVERVIPGSMDIGHASDEVSNGSVNQRDPGACDKWNFKILLRPPGKVHAQYLLVFGQYADAKPARAG